MFCVLWHFGDWISRTAILSATEKGVLFDLLVFYYTVERAITREECKRIARAYSQEERDAMQYVLQNFFIEDGDSYKNNRCEEEIAKAKESSEKKRSAANARWSKQGASKDKNSETDVSASGVDMQKQCTRIPDALQTNNRNPITNNQIDVVTDTTCQSSEDPPEDGLFGEEKVQKVEPSGAPNCPTQKIVDLYHKTLPELPKVTLITSARQTATRSRWRDLYGAGDFVTVEQGIEVFKTYFEIVKSRDFLMGRCKPGGGREVPFRATYDWLMKQANFMKVCEGNYANSRRR